MLDYKILKETQKKPMKKAIEVLKNTLLPKACGEDRITLKKRSRPNRHLHRGQIRAMTRWEQSPIVAFK